MSVRAEGAGNPAVGVANAEEAVTVIGSTAELMGTAPEEATGTGAAVDVMNTDEMVPPFRRSLAGAARAVDLKGVEQIIEPIWIEQYRKIDLPVKRSQRQERERCLDQLHYEF